jgi:transcriptional regulator with XRE-family HTH domain
VREIQKGHLHLVTETSEKPKKRVVRRSRFSDEQRRMLGVALKTLKEARYGTWRALADALQMPQGTLSQVMCGTTGSMAMAYRVAVLAGVPVEVILSGKITVVGRCPECGQPMPERGEDGPRT